MCYLLSFIVYGVESSEDFHWKSWFSVALHVMVAGFMYIMAFPNNIVLKWCLLHVYLILKWLAKLFNVEEEKEQWFCIQTSSIQISVPLVCG